MRHIPTVAAFLCLLMSPLHAEVIDAQPGGFLVRNEALINAPPDRVYRALLRIGRWWDPEHTYSGDARNLSLDARPGGCFCEKIPGKGAIEHMRIIYVSKNQLLRMNGALGPLQDSGIAGSLSWGLTAEGSGTRLMQTYSVGGYRQGGFAELAPAVGEVLNMQLQRLKAYIEANRG